MRALRVDEDSPPISPFDSEAEEKENKHDDTAVEVHIATAGTRSVNDASPPVEVVKVSVQITTKPNDDTKLHTNHDTKNSSPRLAPSTLSGKQPQTGSMELVPSHTKKSENIDHSDDEDVVVSDMSDSDNEGKPASVTHQNVGATSAAVVADAIATHHTAQERNNVNQSRVAVPVHESDSESVDISAGGSDSD